MIATTTMTTSTVGYPVVHEPVVYHETYDEKAGTARFCGFVITLTALISISGVASLITWLILRHAHNPVFRVERLAVSGFNVTNPQKFAAEWGTNLMVENPNGKFKLYIDQVQCYVYYKEEFLASSSSVVGPLYLPRNGRESVEVVMKTKNAWQPSVGWWVVDEMGKDRNGNGAAVSFNLRMLVDATLKAGIGRSKHVSLKVNCEDLKISFVGNETSGVFAPGDVPKQCLVQDV